MKELSVKIKISMRSIQQILRLNYLAPKIKVDIINGEQPRGLRLVDMREIQTLWGEHVSKNSASIICGNKMPTRCNRCFLLQILLLAQHVSGTIMPIIRSSRVLYRWLLPVVFGAWFSNCRYGVELNVVCQAATNCIILSSS